MKALISPIESVGSAAPLWRIAEIHPDGFDVAPPLFWVECPVDTTTTDHGFDPSTGGCVALPAPPPPAPAYKDMTSLQFLDLFTPDEQLAAATAAMQSAPVKLWYDRMLAADFVTAADPRTAAGLDALVSAGLLTADRKATILSGMVG